MKTNRKTSNVQIEQHDFPINIVTSTSIYLSMGITVSVIMSGYKLGIGETPIVSWSWWIIATPALVFPIFIVIFLIVEMLMSMIFHRWEEQP